MTGLDRRVKDILDRDKGKIRWPREARYWRQAGRLYYLKLEVGEDLTLYKIGFTAGTVARRIETLGIPGYIRVTVLGDVRYKKAGVALGIEGRLHEIYKKDRWHGFGYLDNGNTEVYVRDVLGLDRGKAKTVISLGI